MTTDDHDIVGVFLLPPAPHLCQECAVDHNPLVPHNAQTLYYSVWFQIEHGREPTWQDAMAHCDQAMQDAWTLKLHELGVDITSTRLGPQ